MSVIVGIVSCGEAIMAADSRQSWGSSYVDGISKVGRHGDALVGMAGMAVYERARARFPPLEKGASVERISAWCGELVDVLRAWAKEHGHGEQRNALADQVVELLVATPRGLWLVGGEGSVLQVPRNWHAIGSGGPEARGALHALREARVPKGEVAAMAVRAAIDLDSTCGGHVATFTTPMRPPQR